MTMTTAERDGMAEARIRYQRSEEYVDFPVAEENRGEVLSSEEQDALADAKETTEVR